jgi:hypothetical protein
MLDYLDVQMLLVPEVIVHCGRIRSGAIANLAYGRGPKSPVREHLTRRFR